jgi:hypothetical protein
VYNQAYPNWLAPPTVARFVAAAQTVKRPRLTESEEFPSSSMPYASLLF